MKACVIDINGVLGDVKRINQAVAGRTPDAFLTNAQQLFYWRPGAEHFLQRLKQIPDLRLFLWTSRTKRNAAPIEQMIRPLKVFDGFLHGEDCAVIRDFHPVKDVGALRRKYPDICDTSIVFVDDSPKYVATDAKSDVLKCHTYDALHTSTNDDRVLPDLLNAILLWNSSTATVKTATD